jgi:hypothetical protein
VTLLLFLFKGAKNDQKHLTIRTCRVGQHAGMTAVDKIEILIAEGGSTSRNKIIASIKRI